MKRVVLTLVTASAAWGLAACGGGEVTVQAQLEQDMAGGGTETVALSELPVRLIPFDRDAVFDSLAQAYPESEPEIPDSIFELQERVMAAQEEWRQTETEWGMLRDSLQNLSNSMDGMDQSSGEYFALFQEFNELEGRVNELEEQSSAAFEEFNELQLRLNSSSREITLARQAWGDEAFAPVDSIFMARYEELGLEEKWDTTTVDGLARFPNVQSGDWWVNARYDRQYDELYWNIPIQIDGDSVHVDLTEGNAEVRQKM